MGNIITSLVIESGVTCIGDNAFYGCSNIAGNVTVPNSVTSIGEDAFYQCGGITSVTFSDVLTSIGAGTFDHCTGITSVTLPNSVISIGDYAFLGCSGITSVTIPGLVASIGKCPFYTCNALTAINVDESNQHFSSEDGVLFDKSKNALKECPVGKSGDYVMPNTVSSIGFYAFVGCRSLTSVTIPASISAIDTSAFANCTGLISMTCLNPDPSSIALGTMVFQGGTTNCELYVPFGSYSAYHDAPQWWDFRPITELLPTGIKNAEIPNLKLFPNPVKDDLCITAESPINKVEIYSTDGEMLMQKNNFAGQMNVSSLDKGVYMVKVYTKQGVAAMKMIKN